MTHDPPEEDIEILVSAGLEFLPTFTLPHWSSSLIGERAESYDFRINYPDEHGLALSADEGRHPDMSDLSQLLGWHYPVQGELDVCGDPAWRLLLQVGTYDNGEDNRWWGPGGTIYFMIREEDLAAGRFDNVAFDTQVT